jgi:Galactose binding lectin domain
MRMTSKLTVVVGALFLAVGGCGGSTSTPPKDGSTDAPTGKGGSGGNGGSGGAPADGGVDTGTKSFAVGGTVTGLKGTGLVLSDGLGHEAALTGNGGFTFATAVPAGSDVAVTVSQQPTAPAQVCTVAGGMIASIAGDSTTVAVTCVTSTFTVAGTVSGLTGTGLVLQDNAGDDLAVSASGAFVFATGLASGATFTVSVKTQPSTPAQTCTVSGGSGTIGGANVTSVAVNCGIDTFTIGGTISGLTGTGLVLQNNAGDDLSVTGNGAFAFATPVHGGDAFAVTIKTQPSAPTQTCTLSQGTGTAVAANVSTVAVACTTNTFSVGGTVTGLAGTGLVLQDNLGDNLSVTAGGTFTFATGVASGAKYAVTVLTQPSAPSQSCTVANGAGTMGAAPVQGVVVTCATSSYSIGGTISGLTGTGLKLQNSGGDALAITANGPFAFPAAVASGTPFVVTIASPPTGPDQTCTLSGSTGTVGGANVTSVTVNCDTNQHVVGGTVSGLVGTDLALSLNGGTPQAVTSNGGFAFGTTLPSGGTYTVTVANQPTTPWQTCAVTGAVGTIVSTNISTVVVACTTNTYAVGGMVSGLVGTGLVLEDNGGDDLAIAANGTFTFPAKIASGLGYAVTVKTQPTAPFQTCTVTKPSGVLAGGAVATVAVACVTNTFAVGGNITGLAGTVVVENGTDSLTLTANGPFNFTSLVASGAAYAVTVVTQPATPDQICAVTNDTGTIANAAITDVTITCVTNKYKVGGSASGLTGTGLVLQDKLGDDLIVAPGAVTFTFATSLDSGSNYAVTIKTQPSTPTQTCAVVGGTGKVGASDVSSVTVNCNTNSYVVGGTVTGLAGDGLVIQNNGAHDLSISGSGSFAFTPPLSSGDAYAITVKTNPTDPWQTCALTSGGSGTITNADISAKITCTSNPYPISVAVTNVKGAGLVLQNNAGDNLAVATDGTYVFATPVRSGLTYAVTVLTQPSNPWQTCSVTAPAGSVAGAGVTLAVACVTNPYTIGGTVSGLDGTGLVLENNGGDDLPVSSNGAFTFLTPVVSGAPYAVTVSTQPSSPTQNCVVTNGTGMPNVFNISNVVVSCADVMNCGEVDENQTLMLSCPVGHTIGAVTFASYGTPTGVCGSFVASACSAATSSSVVATACVGMQSCSVAATNGGFGDPCSGTFKHLWVQYTCQ